MIKRTEKNKVSSGLIEFSSFFFFSFLVFWESNYLTLWVFFFFWGGGGGLMTYVIMCKKCNLWGIEST